MSKRSGFVTLICTLGLFPLSGAEAQTASLVADINPSTTSHQNGSYPSQLTGWGGKILFSASTRDAGQELWVTDGTGAGTQRVLDACPGRCGSGVAILASIQGGVILSIDLGLWRSDGTRAGTVPLTFAGEPLSIPGSSSDDQRDFAVASQTAYFSACTPARGCGGWRSDGTLAGTAPIGPFPSSGNPPRLFRSAGDRAFFFSADNRGLELWTVRGTAGPTRLKTFPSGGPLTTLTTAGSRVFFFHGSELWGSDGSPAGTRVLHKFRSLPTFGAWIKPAGGRVYLLAEGDGSRGQQIWRSDGTPEGTLRMTDFGPSSGLDGLDPELVGAVGDKLVFLASDGDDVKAWAVSPATAPAVVDLCGSRCSLLYPAALTAVGGRLLFAAQDAAHGQEPWTTDGTPAGTSLLTETCPGFCGSVSDVVYPVSGAVFFLGAGDLWRTDGTAAGTRRYTDVTLEIDLRPSQLVQLGDRVFFSAETADSFAPTFYGPELWTSDGQPGGTRLVTDIETGAATSFPTSFVALGDSVFFLACTDDPFGGQELWRGSAAGAEALTTGSDSNCASTSSIQQVVRAGQRLFLWRTVRNGNGDANLWATDGTAAGTRQLTTHPEDFSRGETRIVPFQDRVYWLQEDRELPNQVWTSDGTAAGTRKAFDLPDPDTRPAGVAATGDALYVLAVSPQTPGFQVWRTNGTAAGLRKVFTSGLSFDSGSFNSSGSSLLLSLQNPGQGGYELWKVDGSGGVHLQDFHARPRDLVTYQGAFYFFNQHNSSSNDFGLWRSDGTAAGTTLVYRFPPSGGIELRDLRPYTTVFAGRLFFAIDDGVHGAELWSSDGTTAGTGLVKDLVPGPAGSSPANLVAAGGRLFFSAGDGVHGFELFQSDGTAAGIRLVEDLAPETASSYPAQMTVAGDRLYFAADDRTRGTEPWSFPLAGAPGCQPSPASLCLNGGRFRVELTWRTLDGHTGSGRAVALTPDTGYFWFFNPANIEAVVKILDAQSLNAHFWVFYGALSNVEYTLAVTDTQTGLTRHYFNPIGQFSSVGDTQGFGPLGAHAATRSAALSPRPRITEEAGPAALAGCQPGPTRLCLNGNRFAVEATWKDFSGHTGSGQAVSLTGDTGYFWFFDSSNVEMVLKVLDGRAVNGKFWVFYGALSNVEYTVRVTDTATGTVKTYANPAGRFASVGDPDAF